MNKLYKHQQKLVDNFPYKHLLAWGCGTGKTLASIELAKKTPEIEILVVCPKSLKDQWREATKEHTLFWTILTKEEFKKLAPSLKKYNCIIVDEAHFFSGIKSSMSKILLSYIKRHEPEYLYLLTATPYLSTPWNIYTLGRILGYEWNYIKFKKHFFYNIKMGNRLVPVIRKGIENEIASLVNKIGSTVRMEDCIDVPEQTFITETFDLTKEQKTAIESLTDIVPIVRWTKVHQICGGTLKSDGYSEDKFFKSEKLERLKELVTEHKKVLIVCRYNNEVEYLKKTLNGEILTITGKTEGKNDVLRLANKLDECILIVNASCSEGWGAPTFPIMIFYSYDFSLKNYIQMIGRIQRVNNIKKNVYISLIVKDSIDEDVMKCVLNKKDFDIAIYQKGG